MPKEVILNMTKIGNYSKIIVPITSISGLS